MKNDFFISITGKQSLPSSEEDELKVDTVGSYTKRNGARFIIYKEYDEDDNSKFDTAVLKIEGNKSVTLMKSGQNATKLILEKGKRHQCIYGTDFGAMSIGIYTSFLNNDLTDSGGKLHVKYTMDLNSDILSTNELYIDVKPNEIKTKKENGLDV
jgi:uncharacterized beta-barrel protein YwiB (DUF1934 family)